MDTNTTKLTDEQRVCNLASERLGAEAKPESTLRELGADSLDLVELALDLEDEFNVEISDDDLAKVTRISDFLPLVSTGD